MGLKEELLVKNKEVQAKQKIEAEREILRRQEEYDKAVVAAYQRGKRETFEKVKAKLASEAGSGCLKFPYSFELSSCESGTANSEFNGVKEELEKEGFSKFSLSSHYVEGYSDEGTYYDGYHVFTGKIHE